MQHTHTSMQTHTHTHTHAVPHTHVRCRCGGRHTETGASLFTTPMPSQHFPHSHSRSSSWREEQAASAWASAVQAACPSAPCSMSELSAVPAPPMCTNTPTCTHQSLYTCRTHIQKHSQYTTAGRQAASCLPHLLPFHVSPSLSSPSMHDFNRQAGARPSAVFARSLPPFTHAPLHGRISTRHAPCLAYVRHTEKIQLGEGGALGHALRCQHSKVLSAHARICPANPHQSMQEEEEGVMNLSCDSSSVLPPFPLSIYTHTAFMNVNDMT